MKVSVRTYNDAFSLVVAYDLDTKRLSLPGGTRLQTHALAFLGLSIVRLFPAATDVLALDLFAAAAGKKGLMPFSLSVTDRRGHEIFALEPSYSSGCDTPGMRDRIVAALSSTIAAMTPVLSQP